MNSVEEDWTNPEFKQTKYSYDEDENQSVDFEKENFQELDWEPTSFISKGILTIQTSFRGNFGKRSHLVRRILIVLGLVGYNAYLATAIAYHLRHGLDVEWCDGFGFLLILTIVVYWSLFYYSVLKRFLGRIAVINHAWDKAWGNIIFRVVFSFVLLGALLTFLIIHTQDNRRRLISAAGIPILLSLGLILSKHPARVVWRHIFWGTGLQFVFGLLVLRWPFGRDAIQCISTKVVNFLMFANQGSNFVYGFLSSGFNSTDIGQSGPEIILPSVFAFGILPVIFWFSFMVSILYSMGAMTWIIVKIGWLLQISLGTTAAESLCASANIFIGQTEAPLVIKPFVQDMTNSELHAVLTGGFATIAGTVLGAFVSFGIDAGHLLSASLMSAPAALAFSKLIYPETKVSKTTSEKIYESRIK